MEGRSRVPPTGRVRLKLNLARYETLAAERGWTNLDEHAAGLQLSPATVSRMRAGNQLGNPLIAALRRAFPDEKFTDLFKIVPLLDAAERQAS